MPERTCAVCRKRADRAALLRFSRGAGGGLVFDAQASAPGRGAWLHPACVAEAVRKPGGLSRALRGPVVVPSDLVAEVCAELDAAIAPHRLAAARLGLLRDGEPVRSRRTGTLAQKMALRRNLG